MSRWIVLVIAGSVVFLSLVGSSNGQNNDGRCKCVCPDTNVVSNFTIGRRVHTANVLSTSCSCEYVVIPKLKPPPGVILDQATFCPLCMCKYENRNSLTIKVVVILIIFVIALLFLYMLFLLCLDPLIISRGSASPEVTTFVGYQEQRDEEEREDTYGSVPLRLRSASSSGNVLDRVGQQQDRWKRQVQEQRRNIYDKHNMLN